MAEIRSLLIAAVRHPVSFSILVLSAVILIVWFDYKSSQTPVEAPVEQSSADGARIALTPPGSQPKLMDQLADPNQEQSGAPAIDALVGRLEEKVKADPSNLDNRILLAQTYKELGRTPEALEELRTIQKQNADNARANLVLASILSQSSEPPELEESLKLLAKIQDDVTVQPYLVHMYRGDALIRQQNHKDALENWKKALAEMPQADARYATLEKRVMDLTNGVTPVAAPDS